MFYQAVIISLCQQGCVLILSYTLLQGAKTLDLGKDTHIFDLGKINALF